jgi:hypothetical protein
MDGLSTRAQNVLYNNDFSSREGVLAAYKSEKLHPTKGLRPRNYGWKCHKEVAKWLGLPEPNKSIPKTCPHCGGII